MTRRETLLITERGKPSTELRPIPGASDPLTAELRKLAANGVVTLPTKTATRSFTAIQSSAQGLVADAVATDRDERG